MNLWPLYHPDIPDFLNEAMAAPELQRLRGVGMNCGCEYTAFPLFRSQYTYSRYDHSVGCALLTWRYSRHPAATMAALLHDIATPCFAHVVDFMLGDALRQEATEDRTAEFIEGSEILRRVLDGLRLTPDDVSDYHRYPIADNDSPRLSADRLEYTLGNFVYYSIAPRETVREVVDDLTVLRNEDGAPELGFRSAEVGLAFARGALRCGMLYVCPADRLSMQLLSELLRSAVDEGAISMADLWKTEPELIETLCRSERFQREWRRFRSLQAVEVAEGGRVIRAKRRFIDPLIADRGRATACDPTFAQAVQAFQEQSQDEPLVGRYGIEES